MLLTDQRGIVRYYEYLDSYGNIGGRVMMVIGVRSLPDPAPVGLTEWKKTKLEVRHYVPEHGSSIHTLGRSPWKREQRLRELNGRDPEGPDLIECPQGVKFC